MPRGIIMSISGREAVILTKDSDFVKVLLPEGRYDIGQEIDAANAKNGLANKWPLFGAKRLAAAAALLIAVILPVAVTTVFINTNVYAYVTLDINPSTEFSVNVREKIIKVMPLNEDGAVLLEGANLKGREIEYGIEYVVGKACELGYAAPGEEGAVIATTVMDEESDTELEEKVSATLEKTIEHNNLTVETGVLSATKEIKEEAEKAGVSAGKYIIALQASEDRLEVDLEEVKNSSISTAINKAGGNLGSILKKARKTDEELTKLFENNREKLRDKNSRDNDGGREDNDGKKERDNNGRNNSDKSGDSDNNDNARETVRNNNSDNGSKQSNNKGAVEEAGERDVWPDRGSREQKEDDDRDKDGRDNNRDNSDKDNNGRDNNRDNSGRNNNGRDNNRDNSGKDNNGRDNNRDNSGRNNNGRDNGDDNKKFNENYRNKKWRPGLIDDILIHLFR